VVAEREFKCLLDGHDTVTWSSGLRGQMAAGTLPGNSAI
jgi:hypothetical protein